VFTSVFSSGSGWYNFSLHRDVLQARQLDQTEHESITPLAFYRFVGDAVKKDPCELLLKRLNDPFSEGDGL